MEFSSLRVSFRSCARNRVIEAIFEGIQARLKRGISRCPGNAKRVIVNKVGTSIFREFRWARQL
jgi:hypothetical protein